MIQRTRIRNLGPFTDLQSPEFAKVNVILGANGAGKSTFANALALLYSGTARGFETGIGLENLRTIGAAASKKWAIEALLSGKERPLTRTEGEGPKSTRQLATENATGVTGARARACLEAGEFVRLDRKARQRLLLDLAPKDTVILPPPFIKAIKELLGEEHQEIDLTTLERLHKAAYEARTEASRQIKAAGDLAAPERPDELRAYAQMFESDNDRPMKDDDWAVEVAATKIDLGELRGKRERLLAAAAPKAVDLTPYQDALKKTERALGNCQTAIQNLPSMAKLAERMKAIVTEIHDSAATNQEIAAKRQKLTEDLGVAEGTVRFTKTNLDALLAQRTETAYCPCCETKLMKIARGKLEVALRNKYEAACRDRQTISELLKTAPEEVSVQALEREMQQLAAKESDLARLQSEEAELLNLRDADRKALEGASAMEPSPGNPEAAKEAKELGDRIVKGEALLEAMVTYQAALVAHKGIRDKKAIAENRHAALDQLVEDLGPNGIRKNCGNAGMFEFHEDLNALLKGRGFKADLRPAMDAEGDPVITVNGRQVPLGMLSDGERLAFGAAFACAVASYTKLGIVVLDRFEALDPAAGDAVMDMLEASGHQAFVMSVERVEDPEGYAAETNRERGPTRVFLLREGNLIAPGLKAEKGAAA